MKKTQRPRYEQALALAKDDLTDILANISARVPAPVIIFNPASWSRSEVVEVTGELSDINALPAPVQQIDSDTIAFLVKDVPSLGYIGLDGGDPSVENPAPQSGL